MVFFFLLQFHGASDQIYCLNIRAVVSHFLHPFAPTRICANEITFSLMVFISYVFFGHST